MANNRVIHDIAMLTISIASAVEIVGRTTPGNPVAARLDSEIPLGYAKIARLQRTYDGGTYSYVGALAREMNYLVSQQVCVPDIHHLI